jgi:hypothetical protein
MGLPTSTIFDEKKMLSGSDFLLNSLQGITVNSES